MTPFVGIIKELDSDNLRARVRIFGVHNMEDTVNVSDGDLPWCIITYPVDVTHTHTLETDDWVIGYSLSDDYTQCVILNKFANGFSGPFNGDDNFSGNNQTSDTSSNQFASSGQGTQVVEAGPGYTTIRKADGSIVKRTGDRNWRNNNPGNITYGSFARNNGAIGTDGRFAVFPDYETGRAAQEALLFNTNSYRNLTVGGAISRWAPSSDGNHTSSYINNVTSALGVSASTRMSDLTPAQRTTMMNTMQRVEGFRAGNETVLQQATSPNNTNPDSQAPSQGETATGNDQGTINIPGNSNLEKAYNFLYNKLVTHNMSSNPRMHVAAAIGVLMTETYGFDGKTGRFGVTNDLSTAHAGGYKGRAIGIAQWLGSRRTRYLRRYGKSTSISDQLNFLWWELMNTEIKARKMWLGASTLQEAVKGFSFFERNELWTGGFKGYGHKIFKSNYRYAQRIYNTMSPKATKVPKNSNTTRRQNTVLGAVNNLNQQAAGNSIPTTGDAE